MHMLRQIMHDQSTHIIEHLSMHGDGHIYIGQWWIWVCWGHFFEPHMSCSLATNLIQPQRWNPNVWNNPIFKFKENRGSCDLKGKRGLLLHIINLGLMR